MTENTITVWMRCGSL